MRWCLIFMLLLPHLGFSQNNVTYEIDGGVTKTAVMSDPDSDSSFNSNVILQKAPHPPTERPEANQTVKRYGARAKIIIPSGVDMPYPGTAFTGNNFDARVPNDNSIAVSKDGKIVSAINATVNCFDQEGALIDGFSLNELAQPLGLNQLKYDPRVIYDPEADRFIIVYLNGFKDSTSAIVLAFSSTDNPADGWHLYQLPGNPDDDQTTTDFPAISITNEHLYITVNTYDVSTDTSLFKEGLIWKVGKGEGYQGGALNYQRITGLTYGGKSFFSLLPVRPGKQLFGPDMYFLGNRGTEAFNDSIFLFQLKQRAGLSDTMIIHPLVSPLDYRYPPLAEQPGIEQLETNDARITGAFLHKDCLQFVATTAIPNEQHSGIFHGLIWEATTSQPTLDANIINIEDHYCAYPNIATTATDGLPYASMIIFNYSAANRNPGFGTVFYDNDQPYSQMVTLKEGQTSVTIQPAKVNRWGDYTGIQPHYGDDEIVWTAGSYGKNQTHNTWISKVHAPTPNAVQKDGGASNIIAYPNPFEGHFRLKFNLTKAQQVRIQLMNADGKMVQTFMEGYVKQGNHTFTFSPNPLPAGTYLLSVENEKGEMISTRKLIKQ